jgi:hypothetical protein
MAQKSSGRSVISEAALACETWTSIIVIKRAAYEEAKIVSKDGRLIVFLYAMSLY